MDDFATILNNLPDVPHCQTNCNQDCITLTAPTPLTLQQHKQILQTLQDLRPWRKGPFRFFDIFIDSEWRSDLKWNRLKEHLPPLKGKAILDIGCSSGYYMFRMLSHRPQRVLGIDPSTQFYHQFQCLQKYIQAPELSYQPIGLEDLADHEQDFDVIFCMGILYHRRDPMVALRTIHQKLKSTGTLILEGLYIEGNEISILIPQERYAKMKNVYEVPTLSALCDQLEKAGYKDIQIVSKEKTTLEEQRKTDWILGESLETFLDPNDPEKTVEGYPAPRRFILLAQK
jgi:tRNA (mo5U34)-methyltransferase